jgi:hypothetical protein
MFVLGICLNFKSYLRTFFRVVHCDFAIMCKISRINGRVSARAFSVIAQKMSTS